MDGLYGIARVLQTLVETNRVVVEDEKVHRFVKSLLGNLGIVHYSQGTLIKITEESECAMLTI